MARRRKVLRLTGFRSVCVSACTKSSNCRGTVPWMCKGKKLPLPQPIVYIYSKIQQLVQDNKILSEKVPNLVLVTLNTSTVASWIKRREKRVGTAIVLQGVKLPEQLQVAEEPLVPAREQPSSPVTHGHSPLSFNEPENREGESRKRKRKKSIQATPTMPAMSHQWPQPHHQYGWSAWTGWPPMMLPSQQQWFQLPPPPPTEQPPLSSSKKSAYRCAVCGKQKAKSTAIHS